MIVRSHFNLNATVLKLVLIYLLSLPLCSNLGFAEDPNFSNGPSVDEKFFVLVEIKNNFLNVRQDPSNTSPVIGKLLKGSEVPLIDMNGDGGTNGNWYRVEIKNKKVGWVSKNYSRKIKKQNQTANVRAVSPAKKDQSTDKTEKKTKPWANIDGFRSAKFGMTMNAVKKAIIKDFSIPEDKIKIINHPIELTKSLGVTVENLVPESRKSRVVYVFGFESKQLTQVNILTGHPMDTNATPEEIINSGNLLGEHFLKKRYQDISKRRVKLAILLQFIAKENKISVDEKELSNGMMRYTSQYPGQEKQIIEYFKKNPSSIETIRGPILEEKNSNFKEEFIQLARKVSFMSEIINHR